jgi:uroporphyrinogen-III synthase
MAKYKVLSTKKLLPSLVEQAKQNDIEIIEQEFISIKPVWAEETCKRILGFAKSGLLNIALTSASAVDVLSRHLVAENTPHVIEWNIFCLSGKTRQAVQSAHFLQKNIAGEADNALDLAKKIIDSGVKEIIFFCGNKRREELPATLSEKGIKVHEVVLYETSEAPSTVNENFDGILFFSPSGVQSFFSANQLKKDTVCFAIGRTTAASITTFTKNKIVSSSAPDQADLLEEVIEHFKQKFNSGISY